MVKDIKCENKEKQNEIFQTNKFNLSKMWDKLYKNHPKCELFKTKLFEKIKTFTPQGSKFKKPHNWHQKSVIYSLYVDLFAKNFANLSKKIGHFTELGVDCLWLLPIMDSPMKDNGYDIRNYYKLNEDLFESSHKDKNFSLELMEKEHGTTKEQKQFKEFEHFIESSHQNNIKLIIDIPLNHTSDQMEWFLKEKEKKLSILRKAQKENKKISENEIWDMENDFYIWTMEPKKKFDKLRILFDGMEESNWEKAKKEEEKEKIKEKEEEKDGNDDEIFFFHRFYNSQPDLNFRNPEVLFEMCSVLLFWIAKGIDGIRLDAIPFLWKENIKSEGDDFYSENLPETHFIIRIFRLMVEMIKTNTLLLAEACQKPEQIVKYFGNEKAPECNAAYHFPLMNKIFYSICSESHSPIFSIFQKNSVINSIPNDCCWFTFVRCHDELTLEFAENETERSAIYKCLCKQPEWDFRKGFGIAGRIFTLFKLNVEKTLMCFSILLSLVGTPCLYYGDEIGQTNDIEFFEMKKKFRNGNGDARDYNRGKFQWEKIDSKEKNSIQIFEGLKNMLKIRKKYVDLFTEIPKFVYIKEDNLLCFSKNIESKENGKPKHMLFVHNLSSKKVKVNIKDLHLDFIKCFNHTKEDEDKTDFKDFFCYDLLNGKKAHFDYLMPHEFSWILLKEINETD